MGKLLNMKKILALVLLLLCQTVLAEESAKQLVKAKLGALKTFKANFEQTVTDLQGEMLQTAEGKIYLSQAQKLYWESLEPNEMLLIADGTTLWHVDPFVEQVIAFNQTTAAKNHPIMLLAQRDSALWNDYLVEENKNSFLLTSIKNDSDYISLTITFQKDILASLEILDRTRQLNKLVFNDVTQNVAIDEQLFQFELPDGFELDDQR